MIANADPRHGIHQEIFGGMFIPIRRPVTRADPSETVTGLPSSFSKRYSAPTAEAVASTSMINACSPKHSTPAMQEGSSARATMYMIVDVVTVPRMCGEGDTCNFGFI